MGDYLEKVLGEAKILASLKHPNILRYCGSWIDGDLDSKLESLSSTRIDDEPEFEMVDESISSSCVEFEQASEYS